MFTFQANLNRSLRDTAVRLAELGWLHNKIRKYADQRSLDRSFGLVGQVCSSLLGLKCLITLRFESGLLFRTVSLVTDDTEKMQTLGAGERVADGGQRKELEPPGG